MSYGETLARGDAAGFVTALALVAEARRREQPRRITIAEIQRRVADHFELRLDDMTSPCRQRFVARPRQVGMYLAHTLAGRSLPQIGRAFGNRDHTTVLHACRQIEALRLTDPDIAAAVDELTAELSR